MGLYISNQWSSRLIEVTSDLPIVGLERSAKFSHRTLNCDRFIIGPQHKSLTADQLQYILTELNFPAGYVPDALNKLSESNQSGFGFERKNKVSTYRLYFEFFDRYRPDPSLNSGILHVGYKWQCDNPAKTTVTRYSFAPLFDGVNSEQVIRKTLVGANENFTSNVVSATMKSLLDTPPAHRIITRAADQSGCRHSFDVNVYKSKKKLDFLKIELENIARFFRIEKQVLDTFLNESGSADVGHISGGFDAVNDPFFTVYFDDLTPLMNQDKK